MLQAWTIRPTKDEFLKVWFSGATAGDICEYFGLNHDELVALASQWGFGSARRLLEVDPTADEIRERAAVVRSRWTTAEERRRRGAAKPLELPRVNGPSWLA
jgi:hypothetical protein